MFYLLFLLFTFSGERIFGIICHNWSRSTFVHVVENMEGSKKKRECALAQFTRYEKKLGEALLNNADNRWALEKIYEELGTRFKDAENAHDSYVTGLEYESATAEGA